MAIDLKTWIKAGKAFLKAAPLIIVAASIITAATENKKDDAVLYYFQKVLDVVALNVGHNSNNYD